MVRSVEMSAEPYTDQELLALGIPLTEEETQDKLANLREEALEHERNGALLAAHYVRQEITERS